MYLVSHRAPATKAIERSLSLLFLIFLSLGVLFFLLGLVLLLSTGLLRGRRRVLRVRGIPLGELFGSPRVKESHEVCFKC